ncbi:SGNH/GDSL hydrolase family protein [Niabella aurantiaca]|uniref:SGNH/GDSL hydrolase family protein n=1 Tax=Niabella aurantiaca TaxID=379900 RepID=UPI00036C03DE|nr:SGNH/GDSL hydrolase family protein [Niabella aurantiaca]
MDHSRRYFLEKGVACVTGLVAGTSLAKAGPPEVKKLATIWPAKLPALNRGIGGNNTMALSVFDCIRCNGLPTEQIVCFGDSITRGDGSNDRESYPGYLNKLLTTG